MSRIGNRKLVVPEGVTIEVLEDIVTVKGPKGELKTQIGSKNIQVKVDENEVVVTRSNEENKTKAMHGTVNANIKNMIEGVTKGYQKQLEILGVGYRFTAKGNTLVINAGYSHPVEMSVPEGLKIEVPSNTELNITGIDKIKVGEFAANVRKVRQPEPYKGKGIRYKDEIVHRKEGKKAA